MWKFQRSTLTCISICRQSGRLYCSSKTDKVIAARYQQKKLFGEVVKKEIPNEIVVDVEDTSVTYKKYTAVNEDTSSEYHWLIQSQQQSKFVKKFKSMGSDEKPAPKLSDDLALKTTNAFTQKQMKNNISNNLSLTGKNSVIISAQNLLNEFIINNHSKTSSNNDISSLFDDNDLLSITKYSIMNDKLSDSQLNEMLCDKRLPSISKVLQATMTDSARIALERWKTAKISELGEAGFNQYQEETLEMGKQFHLAIETYLLQGHEPSEDSMVSKLWQSLGTQLKKLEPNPVLVEKPIIHPDLKYKGIVDNVSYVNNELCALEWKTSEKSKSTLISTFDAPIQLCAYIGALNVDPRYDIRLQTGYVVVAYKNGDTAHIFRLSKSDIRKYWAFWLSRLQEYWIRYRNGTLPDPI